MKTKKTILILFILVALVQLFVPIKMILNRENTINTGQEYKFKTQPLDPNDPFRGKFIRLNFENDTWPISGDDNWESGEQIFVSLAIDSLGYAAINKVSKTKPEGPNYIKTEVKYVYEYTDEPKITIDFPFNRYYMEESKALPAEKVIRRINLAEKKEAYASVFVKNGNAVLTDVIIDNKSIKDVVLESEFYSK